MARRSNSGLGWCGATPVEIAAPLIVSPEDRDELERMAVSSSLPHRVVVQSSASLLAADGESNGAISRACATTTGTVRRWRAKFETGGISAVGSIAKGRGRKPEISQSVIDAIVDDTLHTVPDDESTQWSTRSSCPTIPSSRRSSPMLSVCI